MATIVKSKILFLAVTHLLIIGMCSAGTSLKVCDLKCEYKVNPLGIDIERPRLSWKIISSEKAVMQTAYQIIASDNYDDVMSVAHLAWNTEKINSDQSIHIIYQGTSLSSRQRMWWRIRVWDNKGNLSEWSEPAFWEMGFLETSDWAAEWIEADLNEDVNNSNPCPMMRKEFMIGRKFKAARAYVTCHGLYGLQINGKKVGDQLFTPGWTSYHNILNYQIYDITEMLQIGTNCIGAILGDGWYRGRLIWKDSRNFDGEKVGLLAQLEIFYEDGTTDIIASDQSWKASTGPILFSDIYDGELYDARLEKLNWSKPKFDDTGWKQVKILNYSKSNLVLSAAPAVKKIEEIKPIKILTTPDGKTVADMGQNMVGFLRLKVQGQAGTKVKLTHAEVLDKDGNFYVENLRSAKQTIEYILNGK